MRPHSTTIEAAMRIHPGLTQGKLTVIGPMEYDNSKTRVTKWLCQCKCGNKVPLFASELVRQRKTCGCGAKRREIAPGEVFNRWVVVGDCPDDREKVRCRCVCGTTKDVDRSQLLRGRSTSCGCFREACPKDWLEASNGYAGTREYNVWLHMKRRCTSPRDPAYKDYGGRGIKVCDRWLRSFEAFLEDMGKAPDGQSIDRIDNNGDYEPGNCRWATAQQQARNRRSNVMVTVDGVTKNLVEWLEVSSLPYLVVYKRIKNGWPPALALLIPAKPGNKFVQHLK